MAKGSCQFFAVQCKGKNSCLAFHRTKWIPLAQLPAA